MLRESVCFSPTQVKRPYPLRGHNRACAYGALYALPPPTDEDMAEVLEQVHVRVPRLLRRRGRLPEEPSPTDPMADQLALAG